MKIGLILPYYFLPASMSETRFRISPKKTETKLTNIIFLPQAGDSFEKNTTMNTAALKFKESKSIFVVESDRQSRSEIEDTFRHKSHWNFSYFPDFKGLISDGKGERPMSVLVDIQHFGQEENARFNIQNIEKIKKAFPGAEVLVFSDPEHEAQAAECLKLGALDYIIINPHQFIKLEYELQWLETVLDERTESRKFIKKLFILLGILLLLIAVVVVLYEMGYLKEGTDPNILMGI